MSYKATEVDRWRQRVLEGMPWFLQSNVDALIRAVRAEERAKVEAELRNAKPEQNVAAPYFG